MSLTDPPKIDIDDSQYANVASGTTEFEIPRRWKEIAKCKEQFFRYNKDPRLCSFMNQHVAESWIRSRNKGIDPQMRQIGKTLSAADLDAVLKDNHLLIETAIPLLDAFKTLLTVSGFMLTLHDKNGTLLYIGGYSDQISSFKSINIKIGSVCNEDTSGTTAHSLSMLHKCPIQLLGPENYCNAFQDNISSAAPILDAKGNVISTLVLVQGLGSLPWRRNFENLQSHTLGWVTSMSVAIATQLQLKQRNNNLKVVNNILDTTISFIDDGLFTIDGANTIMHMNKKCLRMLELNETEVVGQNIVNILGNGSSILELISDNRTKQEMEIVIRNKPFWARIIPVRIDARNDMNGAVIQLQDIHKVNALVNRRSGASANYNFESLIGNSEPMRKTKEQAKKFARTDNNVLLIGESGTGKELFAQAIHNEYRPKGPFIAINCAAVPRNLIESELFGYVGGTFTGANREGRPGKIELAQGGTLFLDEIGDMPFEIQSVLLRVLDDKRVMRVGGKDYINVNFRMIAATHKNLYKMVEENQFRHDLYFRLSVLKVVLPPLRDRGLDILTISEHLLKHYCLRMGWKKLEISNNVKQRMLQYYWPGNVRQLENAIIYAANLAHEDGLIDLDHLPEEIVDSSRDLRVKVTTDHSSRLAFSQAISRHEAEKIVIQNALAQTENNIAMAAELLGMGKSTLYRKIKIYGF